MIISRFTIIPDTDHNENKDNDNNDDDNDAIITTMLQ